MVGSEVGETGRIRVDFEGAAEVFPTFVDRVRRAAERHRWSGPGGKEGYPTKACAYVSPSELVEVGTYDPDTRCIDVSDPAMLKEWLGVETLDPTELSVSQ